MNANKRQQIQERMIALSDHELQRVIAFESSDYLPEAVDIAQDDARRRNLDVITREQYWSQFPWEKIGCDGFCTACGEKVTDGSPRNNTLINFLFSTRLIARRDVCPACGLVLQPKWSQVFDFLFE